MVGGDTQLSDSQTFEYLLSPLSWEENGDNLARVAHKLESERGNPFVNKIYCMLIGFALENYYKSAMILLNHDNYLKTTEIGKLHKDFKNHDLIKLVSKARLQIKNDVRKYLEQITEYIIWRGRYPAPVEAKDIRGRIRYFPPSDSNASLKTSFSTELSTTISTDSIHDLINQAKSHLAYLKQEIRISQFSDSA